MFANVWFFAHLHLKIEKRANINNSIWYKNIMLISNTLICLLKILIRKVREKTYKKVFKSRKA
jgi:hypothetical protein